MALCATTALAGAVPRLCVRRARGRFGGFGLVPGVVSLSIPPPRPACSALRVAGRPLRVSLTLARWYAVPRGLSVLRARSGCPSGSPRVSPSCACARALAASAPPPLGGVACAPRVVPALGAGRAVPRGPCPSTCPAPVPCSVWRAWRGAVRSRFPPTWLGAVGVAAARPRRGCLLLLRGASGVMRSPSPDCPPNGRAVGVRDPRVVGAGVRVWGPCSVPSAGTPSGGCAPRGGSVAFMCWGAGWGGGACAVPPGCAAGGVACHRCEGRLLSGAVPSPAAGPLERAARVLRPVCPECGRCGRGDPAPAPQRAPLRAGVARCGGGGRASPGEVPSTIVRGVWGQALSLPQLLAHWAGCWGPPPTCCGCGCVGVGAQHCPLGLHALWGPRAAGLAGGRPRGGVACHGCEGRLVSGAVPPPAARPLERAARVPQSVGPGCGRCGRGDPAPALQRAPLRAGVARCGGG